MDQGILISCGIEYADGLRRCMDNDALYERMLLQYVDDPCVAQAERAFAAGDMEGLSAAVHNLKGSSGTLSLTPVYELTSKMMVDLRSGDLQNLPEQMAQLRARNDALCAAIRRATGKAE